MSVPITIDHLTKHFGKLAVLNDVCLEIAPGELFFLLGPSGCGKTTLLRCLAGFHTPDSGSIQIAGREITNLPPHKREMGMVFQHYALWPHLTLAENVAFGLEMRNLPKAEIKTRVLEALSRVHMAERAHDKPNQLSGGQQQRVALARALVIRPRCILLDEPLSNLDAKLRLEMRSEIRTICKEAGLTAIYVTHDQKEALSIADRIAILKDGVIQQVGTPEAIYERPLNRFVAGFIGEANFISGRVREVTSTTVTVETSCGIFVAALNTPTFALNDQVELCLRPENIRLEKPASALPNRLRGHFCETTYLGEVAQHLIAIPNPNEAPTQFKTFELGPRPGRFKVGEPINLWIEQHHVIITKQTPSVS